MNELLEYIQQNLPRSIFENREDKEDLVGLPYPYTVPSPDKMFREMYYWDTYFTNVGLLACGNIQQAIYNTDNVAYLIDKIGYMPNSNRAHHLLQSQPPFYFRMVWDIFCITKDIQWLARHYETLSKEYDFWMTQRKSQNGLNFYGPTLGKQREPEKVMNSYLYFASRFQGFHTDDEEVKRLAADCISSLCESGWDCCSRFGILAQYHNPVDLNALLYGLESVMEEFSKILNRNEETLWRTRAEQRKELMKQYMYHNETGLYMDWNYRDCVQSTVISVASLYPYFVGMDRDAERAMDILEHKLLLPYGVSCSVPGAYAYSLQWDYPNLWAPLQYIAYVAALNTGREDLALEIAKRYTAMLENNFSQTHNLWEKYDGLTGQVVQAEYEAPPMLGWTAGIYLKFYDAIQRENLQ